jgi:flavin-dependent dehydrogenase
VTAIRLDLGPFAIVGRPRGLVEAPYGYAPRRTSLDATLVEAAAEAGAEVREGFSVDGLVIEDGVVRGIRGGPKAGLTAGP